MAASHRSLEKEYRKSVIKEKSAKGLFLFAAVLSIGFLIAIIVFLIAYGAPFLNSYGLGNFLFGMKWAPLADEPSYGVFPMIVATLILTLLSSVIGSLLGLLVAIALFAFTHYILIKPLKALIELLAGIPSVIYGLFGMILIVPFIRDYLSPTGVGYGILAATLVLTIMILPTMVSVSYNALKAVNPFYYEGAVALGSTKSMAIFKVVVPAAKRGILAGMVLSTGRALGETMAVIMVIGGSTSMPTSLMQSVRTLTANIAMGANELTGDAKSALICSGIVLFVFSLLLNLGFALLERRGRQHE